MRWACILLPQLAMDAALRGRDDPDAPLALIAGPTQRRVLRAVNPAARELGLRPGQTLTAAHALTRDFLTAEYDIAQVEYWHRFLAAWAYRFSSHVSLHFPRALLLEVESSFGLFGPWPHFETRLRQELSALGFRHRIVLAPNPAAARFLTNAHDGLAVAEGQPLQEVLGRLPIGRCGFTQEVATALARMGLRRFQHLLALPRDSLARRFPRDVLQQMDLLLGHRALVLDCHVPADEFDMRIELNFDVESHQALLFPLRRLTADLAAFLAGRDSGVQRFTLHLEHREGPDSQVPVGLLGAERAPDMLFELARGRFEQLQIPGPTQALRLVARDLPAFVPEHRELFDERPQQSVPWEQLRERLRARLGDESVQGIHALADHRPEVAFQLADGGAAGTPQPLPPRPGWLLRKPVALQELAPRILAGPERIESGWWDGRDVRRDYYLVQTRTGQLAWAYCSVDQPGRLMLHGWFA
jgi:protein ImuB